MGTLGESIRTFPVFSVFHVYICVLMRRFSLKNIFEIANRCQRLCTFSKVLDTTCSPSFVASFPHHCVDVTHAAGGTGSFICMSYAIPPWNYNIKYVSILTLIKYLIYFPFCSYYR